MAMSIMIQGTMSNVGKSILTAALCRIFKNDGYRTTPFKAQNMALNSFVTKDALEMGRAQVIQAEAAGIEPSVLMNPILLKPTGDMESQVIVNGKAIGNMTAKEYYKNKKKFIPDIMKAYNFLDKEYDIIVIEGAGSPAEINLKDDDIVNMGMARLAEAPVLLVGDIDRGGVFAQLIGTVDLLEDNEKCYIKGMIVNKFRGDKEILKTGIDMLEKLAKKPVIGIVPYMNCDIDDEDSLSERFKRKREGGIIDIAVIKLPRISNFTDFNALERFDEINLYYAENADEIKDPDILIIPGTKNTSGDLKWLREKNFDEKIKYLALKEKIIFGICGGFQILGEKIYDYDGSGNRRIYDGIGLLPINTNFEPEKIKTRVKGKFINIGGVLEELSGVEFEGYEIHNGVSEIIGNAENMSILYSDNFKGEKADGVSVKNIYGTYIHGIFDKECVVRKIILAVMRKKGINNKAVKNFNMEEYKRNQYDLLAETVRKNVDMDMIYKILKEGIKQ